MYASFGPTYVFKPYAHFDGWARVFADDVHHAAT